jgi:hypothetical protein
LGAPLVRNQGQHGSLTPRKDLAEAESLIEKTLVEVAALEQTFPGGRPGSHTYHSPTAGKAQEPGKPPTTNHLHLHLLECGPGEAKGEYAAVVRREQKGLEVLIGQLSTIPSPSGERQRGWPGRVFGV